MMILGFNKRGKTGGVEQLARDHYVHLDDDGIPKRLATEMIRNRKLAKMTSTQNWQK
jgi:hypothetical protein